LKGFAGSGKSYMIHQLKERLGKRFGYLAYTHTAKTNIDGQTTHSFLGISVKYGKSSGKTIERITKNYDGVIIDEINMLPLVVYRILCMLTPKSWIF